MLNFYEHFSEDCLKRLRTSGDTHSSERVKTLFLISALIFHDNTQLLIRWSNVNRAGQWVFQIGPLRYGEAIKLPDNIRGNIKILKNILNLTFNKLIFKDNHGQDHIKTCRDGGATHCHSKATCIDYNRGFCCSCKQGFFGNGESCQPRGNLINNFSLRFDEPKFKRQ